MAGFDFLKATKKGMLTLKRKLNQPDQVWFVDLISTGIDSRVNTSSGMKTLCSDEIYELACYFNAVKALHATATSSKAIAPAGTKQFRFAYSPGQKENFVFFRICTPAGVLDCLLGIKIPVPMKSTAEPPEAPDISVERMETKDQPNSDHGELLAIWECKYHKLGNPLSKSEFNQMIGRLDIFGPRQPVAGDIFDTLKLPEPFECCAILTTSAVTSFNLGRRYYHGFSIAFGYNLKTVAKLEPTRVEHLLHVP